ncbi:putative glycolipid-binding domain-containing protein [Paraburkholderia phymatum]|uniref:Glycolipid-binding domain-containing protein n=1 Tax=Paraburkholderia phymatum TaxID=148447 RepID=A0ACC6TX09_9BURK
MREVRWTPEEGDGVEHLAFDARADGFHAESVLVGERNGHPYGLFYRVKCDLQWRTVHVWLKVIGGPELDLHGDGEGNWHDGHGLVLASLAGCIDIDIAATPYTNTLPIRRLQLAKGARETIPVVFISTPDLQISRVEQAYACVEPGIEYRYEGIDTGFAAELKVDEDGLVIDYPTMFTRTLPLA